MPKSLSEIAQYLDEYLEISDVSDDRRALNGLQVEAGPGTVSRIAAAVDVCQATIAGARATGADLLLVHHGLFWGGLQAVTGGYGRRLRTLFEGGLALYSAHLPLDRHPEVGNNAVLAHDLGITTLEPFGTFDGVTIGRAGTFGADRATLVERITSRLGVTPRVIAAGPGRVRRVGVVTGAGSDALAEVAGAGLDTLVTGEAPHHAALEAEELGVNLVLAGHYATETVGVQALAAHLERQFAIPWTFIDHPTGL